MQHPTLIGVIHPTGGYTARWLRHGGCPDRLMPVLRAIWSDTFGRGTATMAATLLAQDWTRLLARPRPGPGVTVVAGVGRALHTGPATCPRRGRADSPGDRDPGTRWLYLIDRRLDTVEVHRAAGPRGWTPHSRHHLDTSYGPPAVQPRPASPPAWQWATPAQFADAVPDLAEHGLALVSATLSALAAHQPAAILDDLGGHPGGHVRIPAPGHALTAPAAARPGDPPTARLSRPLGADRAEDPLVVRVFTARHVEAVCARVADEFADFTDKAASEGTTTLQLLKIIDTLHDAGVAAGRAAAERWARATLDRRHRGDLAARVLAELDNRDPALILNSLPACPVSTGQYDTPQAQRVYDDYAPVHAPQWDTLDPATRDEATEAFALAYTGGLLDRVADLCAAAIAVRPTSPPQDP
ncbi:MAG: hypothetical protein ACRDT6_13110 [Micromonosporaceae bacterium]